MYNDIRPLSQTSETGTNVCLHYVEHYRNCTKMIKVEEINI